MGKRQIVVNEQPVEIEDDRTTGADLKRFLNRPPSDWIIMSKPGGLKQVQDSQTITPDVESVSIVRPHTYGSF